MSGRPGCSVTNCYEQSVLCCVLFLGLRNAKMMQTMCIQPVKENAIQVLVKLMYISKYILEMAFKSQRPGSNGKWKNNKGEWEFITKE